MPGGTSRETSSSTCEGPGRVTANCALFSCEVEGADYCSWVCCQQPPLWELANLGTCSCHASADGAVQGPVMLPLPCRIAGVHCCPLAARLTHVCIAIFSGCMPVIHLSSTRGQEAMDCQMLHAAHARTFCRPGLCPHLYHANPQSSGMAPTSPLSSDQQHAQAVTLPGCCAGMTASPTTRSASSPRQDPAQAPTPCCGPSWTCRLRRLEAPCWMSLA